MKSKFLFSVTALIVTILLASWGVTAHRSIAKIAENHLSAKASVAVKAILGDEEMPLTSTYADEIRGNQNYQDIARWHYLNLPQGYNYVQFVKYLKGDSSENVYNALLKMVGALKNSKSTRDEKLFALKMVIHLVGDLHQPMHVSRAEDNGGNKIKLKYNQKETNLHSIWDSSLIDYNGLTYTEMATALDKVSDANIKKWQSEDITMWLFESYQISASLYKEVEGKTSLDYDYYPQHAAIYKEQIQKAGIRLAGLLNEIYR